MEYEIIVIGSSAGGLNALKILLSELDGDFSMPIMIVQHVSPHSDNFITQYLDNLCQIRVKEADEKEDILSGTAYFAPPNFHLMIEEDFSISLSTEERVNYARPSIDVLFETAVYAYHNKIIGIILTGANHDGSGGMKKIKDHGGLCIVQDPKEAEVEAMPQAALGAAKVDHILELKEIAALLNTISRDKINKKN